MNESAIVLGRFAQVRGGFAAILAHRHIEFQHVPLVQLIQVGFLHFGDVNKDVLRFAIGGNKAVTFCRIKPFDCSTHLTHVLVDVGC